MLPVLREYGIPAVAYVSPGLIECEQPTVDLPEDYMTWDQIRTLTDHHVAIGSHGWSHRSLGQMSLDEAQQEALRSRQTLEERLGRPVNSLAYPYGTRADYSEATARMLGECDYTTAFTSQHGAVLRGLDALNLPRVKVEGGESLAMFQLICRGALDAWRLVDQALWQLQQAGK